MTTPDVAPLDPGAAFRSPAFRAFQAKRLAAILASQIQSVAVGWDVYSRTGRAIDLGYVGLAQFLPAFAFLFVTGGVADRFDRRRVLVACHVGQAILSLALWGLASAKGGAVWPIYAVLFGIGTTRAFAGPADQAILPNLVPKEHFTSAVAWSSSLWQGATILGPSLGGLIFGAWGLSAAYATSAGLSLVAVGLTLLVKVRGRVEAAKRGISFAEVFAGVRYVAVNRVVLGALSLDLFAVLLGGATALLPVYARDILSVGPLGLGLLRSAPAIGAAVTGLIVAYRPLARRAGVVTLTSVAIFGAATVVFGLSRNVALSVAALLVLGAADMVSVVVRTTLVQFATPDAMRGRVSAVNSMFIVSSNELGEFESGLTAAWLGPVTAVVVGGVGTIAVVALWWFLFPSLRRIDRLDEASRAREGATG